MRSIPAIDPAQATGKTKQLLDAVHAKLGVIPNVMKTFANSPSTLEAKFGDQLALAAGQKNSREYCLGAHTYLGANLAHLGENEILMNRKCASQDEKTAAGLKFAARLLETHGPESGHELSDVRAAGYTDAPIVEIAGHVALNVLTNYFNTLAGKEVDFPKVSVGGAA